MVPMACAPQEAGKQVMNGSQHSATEAVVAQTEHYEVSKEEVFSSIETLYKDELKPYGRILRKRLVERAIEKKGCSNVDVDIQDVKDLCMACFPKLCVHAEEGGEWSVTIGGRKSCFVDVYSPNDNYPTDLWERAAVYFDGVQESIMVLPGGRYSCAQALMACQLPFLAGRSLGQVSHIVQLAISQKKMLGYLNGAVVPYKYSQSMVKEKCAERQRPCMGSMRRAKKLATWDNVRTCLQQVLKSCVADSGFIPLSNVKRLFRSKCRLELSETALGHSKLSELLQDDRLSDVCDVQLHGHGYIVIPNLHNLDAGSTSLIDERLARPDARESESAIDIAFIGAGKVKETAPSNKQHNIPVGPQAVAGGVPSALHTSSDNDGVECRVYNTFIHLVLAASSDHSAFRRSKSLPRDLGSQKKDAWETTSHPLVFISQPLVKKLHTVSGSSIAACQSEGSESRSTVPPTIASQNLTDCASSDCASCDSTQ